MCFWNVTDCWIAMSTVSMTTAWWNLSASGSSC